MFYSQAPWPQCTKLGTNVAKGIICDVVVFFFFSGEPPLSYSVEKRRDPKNCAPLRVWIYLLRKCAYIDFLYIILKHTQ